MLQVCQIRCIHVTDVSDKMHSCYRCVRENMCKYNCICLKFPFEVFPAPPFPLCLLLLQIYINARRQSLVHGSEDDILKQKSPLYLAFNPFMPSRPFHLFSLDRSISSRKGVWLDFIIPQFREISVFHANSIDPDQMTLSAASDLGLHCLQITLLWDARLKWVNCNF